MMDGCWDWWETGLGECFCSWINCEVMSLREGCISAARLPTFFETPGSPPGGPPYLDSCLAMMYLSWLVCMIGLCPF